jgi:phosphodiesterase/alkaline phosphatase D-like protein
MAYYIVRAVSGDVESRWTAAMAGATKAVAPQFGPVLTGVPTGETMIRLSWPEVDGATSYVLEWIAGDLPEFTDLTKQTAIPRPATATYYLHRNLSPGQIYSYRMKAVLADGVESGWSEAVLMRVTRPRRPQLTARALDTTAADMANIRLTWAPAKMDIGGADDVSLTVDDYYEVQSRVSVTGTWAEVTATIDCTTTAGECILNHGSLNPSETYYYRIRVNLDTSEAGTVTDVSGHPPLTSYWDDANQQTQAFTPEDG